MVEEKRRYIRWRKKIRVTYSVAEDRPYEEVFTENISEVGLQVLLADRLAFKQTVWLKLEFTYDSVPILAVARVAHLKNYENQYRVGLEFINMSDFEKQRLKRALDKLGQDFKEETGGGYAPEETR